MTSRRPALPAARAAGGASTHARLRARRSLARATAALLACVLALLCAGGAFAHAALVASEPSDGTILAESPETFRLTFNEPVSPLVLKLARPDGSIADLPQPVVAGETLTASAPEKMSEGSYVLSWRVVSLDGHPVGGTIVFSLGYATGGSQVGGAAMPSWDVLAPIWIAKALLYAGLFFGAGAALSHALIAPLPPAARSLAVVASAIGFVAAILSIGLQGLDALDAPLNAFLHWAVWAAGFATTYGLTAAFAVLASLLSITAVLVKNGRWTAPLSLAAGLGVGLAFTASGHASDAPPQWLTRPAVFLHAVALAFWIGALAPLGFSLRGGGAEVSRGLARFSRLIPYAIAPLVLSGVALAVVQVETPSALISTGYGRVLVAKLALLAPLFALAAWNRWRLTAPAKAGDPAAAGQLVRLIVAETVLIAAILGVVALWRFTPPPRALLSAEAPPAQAHLHNERVMAHLSLSPGRVGRTSASIAVMDEESKALQADEVTLALKKPDSGLEAITRSARKASDGLWQVDDLVVPLAGQWSATVEIRIGDFQKIRLEGPLEIPP